MQYDRATKQTTMQILNCCLINNKEKMNLTTFITLITAITALITGIYSIYHSRKTTYINAVTTERLKYIDNLRNYISEFCGLLLHTTYATINETEIKSLNEKLDLLRFSIYLNLNRKDHFDKILLEQLESIPNFPDSAKITEHLLAIKKLTNYAQDIFTLEWAGIKLESSKGNLYEWQKNKLRKKHKKTYGNDN